MNKNIKRVSLLFIFILTILLVGCNKSINLDDYEIGNDYKFSEELDYNEVLLTLNNANKKLNETKSYSYTQNLSGEKDNYYSLTGVTKIDMNGNNPKASMVLTGDLTYEFYIKDDKAYFNMNGKKTYTKINKDLSDLINDASIVVGGFKKFDENEIKEEDILNAGILKNDVTIIEFTNEDNLNIGVVIKDDKILKVMYKDIDLKELTIIYDYSEVEVTYPTDLSEYEEQ